MWDGIEFFPGGERGTGVHAPACQWIAPSREVPRRAGGGKKQLKLSFQSS